MTFSDNRTRATRRVAAALRWGGTMVAVGALVALGLVNASGPAKADSSPSGYDQMNGTGSTASAVTVQWTSGLLDSSNHMIANPGSELNPNVDRQNGTGSYAFMDDGYTNSTLGYTNYGAFKNLAVTVSQTQDIGHGGVTVSWKGGQPTVESGGVQSNYLQIMECYGNATTAPARRVASSGKGCFPRARQPTWAAGPVTCAPVPPSAPPTRPAA